MDDRSSIGERRNVINGRDSRLHWLNKGLKKIADPITEQPIPDGWENLLKNIDEADGENDERPAPDGKT